MKCLNNSTSSCVHLVCVPFIRPCTVVLCVYLFHELPPAVRRAAAAEMARVLKPGGLLVLTDSVWVYIVLYTRLDELANALS